MQTGLSLKLGQQLQLTVRVERQGVEVLTQDRHTSVGELGAQLMGAPGQGAQQQGGGAVVGLREHL